MTQTSSHARRSSKPARAGDRLRGGQHAAVIIDISGLERNLRQAVAGEVRFDATSKAMYANDGSNFRQVPIGVVIPATMDDIVATHRVRAPRTTPTRWRWSPTTVSDSGSAPPRKTRSTRWWPRAAARARSTPGCGTGWPGPGASRTGKYDISLDCGEQALLPAVRAARVAAAGAALGAAAVTAATAARSAAAGARAAVRSR